MRDYFDEAKNVVGVVELTKPLEGMPVGTLGKVIKVGGAIQRVIFNHYGNRQFVVPVYEWVPKFDTDFWLDSVRLLDGPLAEVASEVLNE